MRPVFPVRACLPFTVVAALSAPAAIAPEPARWQPPCFEPLDGPLIASVLEPVFAALRAAEWSACDEAPFDGTNWPCITEVLGALAAIEAEVFASGTVTLEDTHHGLLRLQMRHAGRLWSYWHHVAQLKLDADRLGGEVVLAPGLREVLRQMERAFSPVVEVEAMRR